MCGRPCYTTVMRTQWVPLLLVTFGCSESERALPDDFLLGAAVAGFQIEMGCPTIAPEQCEDRNSDWYEFVTSTVAQAKGSNFLAGDPTTNGPGYFELYEQDIARLSELNLDGFRFSIEWSRVFPKSTIGVQGHDALKAIASAEALDYYRKQLAALKARGITPLVTLHHYTLPNWMHDAVGCNQNLDRCSPRGWLEPHVVDEIAKYAGFVARELGGDVDLWVTLNEPLAVVLPGYLFQTKDRTNPPAQLARFAEAKTAMVAMIEAHARMVDAVRENDTTDADGDGRATFIGVVYPVAPVLPKDAERGLDRLAAKNIFYLYNEVFLDAVILGNLDHDADGVAERRDDLVGRSDYLGLNYYTAATVVGERESFADAFSPLLTLNPFELEQGQPFARGIYDMLLYVRDRYDLPVYVTENGTYPELGAGQEAFLAEHLQWVLRAVHRDEVDVRGYFWWSLTDNYEWNHGMALRFGLYEIDTADPMKKRTRRPVGDTFGAIGASREISAELAERFPIAAQ